METPHTPTSPAEAWSLDGPLTVYTVADVRSQWIERLTLSGGLLLDLSRVTACDCAGLQLLCAAHKQAQQQGKPFRVHACSPAIQNAADSIGLDPASFLTPLGPVAP